MLYINPLPTGPVTATGLCKDAADWASRQKVKAGAANMDGVPASVAGAAGAWLIQTA